MSGVWDRVYQLDNTFFGEEPSQFAAPCFKHMKSNNLKKVLEIEASHVRDTIFNLVVSSFILLGFSPRPVSLFHLNHIHKKRNHYAHPNPQCAHQ